MYILCIVTGVSSLTRTIPLRNVYTPCVATGARIRRVYSYLKYIHALCIHGGEFSHQDYSFTEYLYFRAWLLGRGFAGYIPTRNIYTSCVVRGGEVFHQDYSFTEYLYAVCSHEGDDSPGTFLYGIYTRRV